MGNLNREKLFCAICVALSCLGVLYFVFQYSPKAKQVMPPDPGGLDGAVSFRPLEFFGDVQSMWPDDF